MLGRFRRIATLDEGVFDDLRIDPTATVPALLTPCSAC